MFVEIYGGVCGDFSTLMMPYGGIYILGGISVALEPIIVNKRIFMKAYADKGWIKPFLEQMSIMIITVHDIALEDWGNIVEDWLKGKKRWNKCIF